MPHLGHGATSELAVVAVVTVAAGVETAAVGAVVTVAAGVETAAEVVVTTGVVVVVTMGVVVVVTTGVVVGVTAAVVVGVTTAVVVGVTAAVVVEVTAAVVVGVTAAAVVVVTAAVVVAVAKLSPRTFWQASKPCDHVWTTFFSPGHPQVPTQEPPGKQQFPTILPLIKWVPHFRQGEGVVVVVVTMGTADISTKKK